MPDRRPANHQNPEWLDHVRALPCVCCHRPGPNEPHHVHNGGMSRKGPDTVAIALCRRCHQSHHDGNHPNRDWCEDALDRLWRRLKAVNGLDQDVTGEEVPPVVGREARREYLAYERDDAARELLRGGALV